MRRFTVAIALMLLAALSALASNAKSDVGKSWSITLYQPTRVGASMLPAGDYSVRHVQEGEQHFLVFRSENKEVARVMCTTEQLAAKSTKTVLTQTTNAAGQHVLVGIAFEGGRFRHNLAESVAQVR